MAPPFLAITLDLKRLLAQAAGALGHPHPGPVAWGFLELLEDVWRRKDPSITALLLTAWFGPDPRVPDVLVGVGLLLPCGVGWELCPEEADRLLLTHKQRVAAGKERTATATRDRHGRLQRATSGGLADDQRGTSGAPAADLLLHPASSIQHPDHSPSENPRAAPADDFALEEQRPTRTRKPSRQQALYTALVAHRAEVLGPDALPDEPWTVQRQNEALGGPILDCEPGLLLAALQRFLESDFAGRCNPPGPLGVFVKQWSRWVSDVMRSNAGGVK